MTERWVFAAFPALAASVIAPSAVASLLAFATPVHAEPMRLAQAVEYSGGLPPYEIATIVRSAGLDPIDRPVRRGPNYVLHAIGQNDQEVRVIVDARRGEIVRIVPTMSASRMPPSRGGYTVGPYERIDGPGRPAPGYGAPDSYRTGARPVDPDDDEDDPSYQTAPRPPGNVPGGAQRPGYAPPPRTGYADPPPVIRATPPAGAGVARGNDLPPPSGAGASAYPSAPPTPRAATAYPPRSTDLPPSGDPRLANAPASRDGMLPPPPERFPQRAAPAAEKKEAPKPVKRAAATAAPKPAAAPVPKPKPATPASVSTPAAAAPATPATPAPEVAKEPVKETAKTPEPAAAPPIADTKPEAEPAAPAAEKPADNAVPH